MPPTPTFPPLSPYGTLTGQLFLYAPGRVAFESPVVAPKLQKKCILLGGLSDGLIPCPYTELLQQACQETGWSLIQPILSSSYTGFGHGRLSRDCQELEELMDYLHHHRRGISEISLVGHSTGCQDIVYFLQHGRPDLVQRVTVASLQAPVSDRESDDDPAHRLEMLQIAQNMLQSQQEDEMMPRKAFWAPISAQRFIDLQDRLGMDDYFSSDLTDKELRDRLGHIEKLDKLQILVACSGQDEYVPSTLNTGEHLQRLCKAMGGQQRAVPLLLPKRFEKEFSKNINSQHQQ